MKKISVLIPVYNKENYINETLFTIDKQVTREEFEIEVVIVDDHSTDSSFSIINNFKWENESLTVKVLQTPINSGPSVAFNLALDNATGEYIVPFDADDLLPRLGLFLRFRHMVEDPSIDWVSGSSLRVNEDDVFIAGKERIKFNNEYFLSGRDLADKIIGGKVHIPAQSLMIKSEVLKRVGWNQNMRSSQDTALHLMLAFKGYKLKRIDDYVSIYRERASGGLYSTSIKSGQKFKDYETMKEYLKDYLTEDDKARIDKTMEYLKEIKL